MTIPPKKGSPRFRFDQCPAPGPVRHGERPPPANPQAAPKGEARRRDVLGRRPAPAARRRAVVASEGQRTAAPRSPEPGFPPLVWIRVDHLDVGRLLQAQPHGGR